MTDATRPLGHVRVLDLSRMFPGAFCTLLLADLGADVLKVEAPGFGDGLRFMTGESFAAAHVALTENRPVPGVHDVVTGAAALTDTAMFWVMPSQRSHARPSSVSSARPVTMVPGAPLETPKSGSEPFATHAL
jgi:hypothetical protein